MSATMARQGGRVQLEQSDMHPALNMAKMAKEGFLRGALEKMQYLMKKPRAKVREEKKRGVESPGHKKVKAAIEKHPAMFLQNHRARCLSCQNGTTKHLQTRWRNIGTGAPPPNQRRQLTPERTPPLAGNPPTQTGNNSGVERSKSSICQPDMPIHIHLFPVLNCWLSMHLPRIASTIQILIQICRLMKQHPLVSTLSGVW